MTKSDLVQKLAYKLKMQTPKAETIVNTIFGSMIDSLLKGERIEIRGFGVFEIRNYKGYAGRNPKTGQSVHVEPKRAPFFKMGKELQERLNTAIQGSAAPEILK